MSENRHSLARARDVITIGKLDPEVRAELLRRLEAMTVSRVIVVEEAPTPVHEVIADCERRNVEHIVGVAVRKDDRVWQLHWPCRHCHVLHMLSQTLGDIGRNEEGFVTNTARFVGRIEGADVAIRAGQIAKLKWPPHLFSEDLW
jgi:hypothetical protein